MNDDAWHKTQYEAALAFSNHEGPAWEDLTDEQRENIRAVNHSHQRFMSILGKAIHDGTELPNPMKDY